VDNKPKPSRSDTPKDFDDVIHEEMTRGKRLPRKMSERERKEKLLEELEACIRENDRAGYFRMLRAEGYSASEIEDARAFWQQQRAAGRRGGGARPGRQ
jgi:hypothetical protein